MAEPEIATVEDIIRAGEREFPVPSLGKSIRCRRISGPEYAALMPPMPVEAMDWPDRQTDPEGYRAAERKWLEGLTDEQVERRRQAFAELDFRVVALASVAPKLTVEDARRLGQEASALAGAILEFSLPDRRATDAA